MLQWTKTPYLSVAVAEKENYSDQVLNGFVCSLLDTEVQ